jgi:hypothetical protein
MKQNVQENMLIPWISEWSEGGMKVNIALCFVLFLRKGANTFSQGNSSGYLLAMVCVYTYQF